MLFLYFTDSLPCSKKGCEREEDGDGPAGAESQVEVKVTEAATWKTAWFWCYIRQQSAKLQHIVL